MAWVGRCHDGVMTTKRGDVHAVDNAGTGATVAQLGLHCGPNRGASLARLVRKLAWALEDEGGARTCVP